MEDAATIPSPSDPSGVHRQEEEVPSKPAAQKAARDSATQAKSNVLLKVTDLKVARHMAADPALLQSQDMIVEGTGQERQREPAVSCAAQSSYDARSMPMQNHQMRRSSLPHGALCDSNKAKTGERRPVSPMPKRRKSSSRDTPVVDLIGEANTFKEQSGEEESGPGENNIRPQEAAPPPPPQSSQAATAAGGFPRHEQLMNHMHKVQNMRGSVPWTDPENGIHWPRYLMTIMRDRNADIEKRTLAIFLFQIIQGCRDWRTGRKRDEPKDWGHWFRMRDMFDKEGKEP